MVSPAPPRGRYDRNLSPEERGSLQKQRLLWATAEALEGSGSQSVSVAAVAKLARVGRNTFYEHFDDAAAAVQAAARQAAALLAADLDRELEPARTPLERVRTLMSSWVDWSAARSALARAALSVERGPGAALLSPAGEILKSRLSALIAEGRQAATFASAAEETKLLACAAASEVLALAVLEGRARPEDAKLTLAELVVRA